MDEDRVVRERIPIERLSWVGLASVPLWLAAFIGLGRLLGARPALGRPRLGQLGAGAGLVLAGVPVFHEAVHGAVAWLVGARPRFGIGPGFAYTTFDEPVTLGTYRTISLAPFVVLSAAGLGFVRRGSGRGVVLAGLVANAAGAFGDFWVVWRTRSFPAGTRIRDLGDGFEAHLPSDAG